MISLFAIFAVFIAASAILFPTVIAVGIWLVRRD